MRIDMSFIGGLMLGIESTEDYDFGGQMIVVDLLFVRFLIKFGDFSEI